MKVDQAIRLPPRSLSISVGLTLKLDSLCITVSVVKSIWALWFVFGVFCVAGRGGEGFDLVRTGWGVRIL